MWTSESIKSNVFNRKSSPMSRALPRKTYFGKNVGEKDQAYKEANANFLNILF